MDNYSRESIKRRMIGRISTLWDIEDIQNLDPVIRLIIEAVSEEIFRLAGEMGNLDDRLLAKLAASLSPVEYITPRPGHALMVAHPNDAILRIDRDTIFSYKESKIVRKYYLDRIDFIPVSPFSITDCSICYVGIASKMYKLSGRLRKNVCSVAQYDVKSLSNSVWIGLNLNHAIEDLKELSIYFDFVVLNDKYRYLKLLSLCKCRVGGEIVSFHYGLPKEQNQAQYLRNPLNAVLSDIRAFYDKHYITLLDIGTINLRPFPKELETYYSKEDIQNFKEPLLWIKLEFPDAISEDVLEQLRISINCFPVANISERMVSQTMGDVTLFLPLETSVNEFFVSINSVSDSSGDIYLPLDRANYMNNESNHRAYTLCKGGVEHYSSTNDTMSTVSRLLDILKDRYLFNNARIAKEFSGMMSDVLNTSNRLTQMIKDIAPENQLKSYLLVDKSNPREILTAKYYTTNGASISKLSFVDPMESNIDSQIKKEFSQLITPITGGYNDPSPERIKDIHRYMLTSSDRIFTKQDIKNFVYSQYSEQVEMLSIENGLMLSNNPREGIVSTIDVILRLFPTSTLQHNKEFIKTELYSKLENRSPQGYNYRVIIY